MTKNSDWSPGTSSHIAKSKKKGTSEGCKYSTFHEDKKEQAGIRSIIRSYLKEQMAASNAQDINV